jgi:hypothetical protein
MNLALRLQAPQNLTKFHSYLRKGYEGGVTTC